MTTGASTPSSNPLPLRSLVRSGLILVAISPLMFVASLWVQSYWLYSGFGVTLNLGFGLVLLAWSSTPTGDGAWPFTPADGPPPRRWAPEFVFWLCFWAWSTVAILMAGAVIWLLISNGLLGANLWLITVMIWCGFIVLFGWPFLFPLAVCNAFIQTGWDKDFAAIKGFIPLKLRERHARFCAMWPNVSGWG
nr:hypothetical protein [Nitrosomonas nitrosa]